MLRTLIEISLHGGWQQLFLTLKQQNIHANIKVGIKPGTSSFAVLCVNLVATEAEYIEKM